MWLPYRCFTCCALVLVLTACDAPLVAGNLPPTDDLAGPPGEAPDLAPPAADPDLATPPRDYCSATDPRSPAASVFATPEAGEAPYLDVLDKARRTIRVSIYLMGYGGILDALIAKARAGVDVKVLLAESERDTNQKYADQLTAAGVKVQWSDPKFTYFHAKYFVVDEAEAVLSTGNYSKSFSILRERNFVARDADPADVLDLVALFDADWNGASPDLSCTRLLVSPVNARVRLLALIDSARETLVIESMQFADSDVRSAVGRRKAAGVEVRALLAEASWISANADAAAYLKNLGVPVRSIPHLHTKMMLVDGERGYIGSENFSWTSLTRNREVGVIVTEPESVKPLADTFEKDWAAGKSF